jgi:hypothetical protein
MRTELNVTEQSVTARSTPCFRALLRPFSRLLPSGRELCESRGDPGDCVSVHLAFPALACCSADGEHWQLMVGFTSDSSMKSKKCAAYPNVRVM